MSRVGLPRGRRAAMLGAMRKLLACIALVVACGDDRAIDPDADVELPVVPQVEPQCQTIAPPAGAPFAQASDFGAITPGTLAGWAPDGRWFVTGVRVGGISSVHLERRGADVVVDRDDRALATLDDDALFHRMAFALPGGGEVVLARRVSNQQPDGSLRFDRAVCDGEQCVVCTARMIRATWHDADERRNLTLVGELRGASWDDGFTFNVRVLGDRAYLIRQDGLRIIDVADPAQPVELGHYRRAGQGYSNDVKLVEANGKRYALIADSPVDVVDVTDPAAPRLAAQIPEEAHTLFTETRGGATYAYFGNYDGSCPVFDVSDPEAPVRLGRHVTAGSIVHDLMVQDGVAYLNAWEAGFLEVDFTTPATPVLRGTWNPTTTSTSHSSWATVAGGRRIALHGDESYGAHLDTVDIDPASPTYMQPLGSYKTRDWVSIHNVMAIGERGYATYYQDGVRVFDLADPTQPTLIGYFNTWDPQGALASNQFFEGAVGLDVDPARRLIFVADSPRGLLILRDDTP